MNTEELRKVAEAATPLDFDSAEMKRRVGEVIECPHCQGEGDVTLEADYCNFDGTAIGVEFYGIGMAHGAAEAFVRAFNPKTAIALLDRIAALEAENVGLRKDAARLDYLQEHGSTVELVNISDECWDFRVGGLHVAVSPSIRAAIDAALKETP